jgi:hypothetical protein
MTHLNQALLLVDALLLLRVRVEEVDERLQRRERGRGGQ